MKTGFDTHIERAQARYDEDRYMNDAWKVVAKRLRAERRVASKLITACLRSNMLVSVNDGGEWVVNKSSKKAEIMAAFSGSMMKFMNSLAFSLFLASLRMATLSMKKGKPSFG